MTPVDGARIGPDTPPARALVRQPRNVTHRAEGLGWRLQPCMDRLRTVQASKPPDHERPTTGVRFSLQRSASPLPGFFRIAFPNGRAKGQGSFEVDLRPQCRPLFCAASLGKVQQPHRQPLKSARQPRPNVLPNCEDWEILLGVATANSIAAISSPGSVFRTDGPAACDCSCRPQPRKAVQDRTLQNCTTQEKKNAAVRPKQGPTAWTTYKAPTPPRKPIV
jgi:hypothetical protein